MPCSKANYIVVWKKSSQVYSASTIETVLKTPVPKGCTPEDKRILFAAYLPDEESFCVYQMTQEQIDEKILELETKEQEKADKKLLKQSEKEEDDE